MKTQISDVYAFNEAARGRVVDGQLIIQWPLLRQALQHIDEERRELFDAVDLLDKRWAEADADESAALMKEAADGACDLAWIAFNVLYCLGISRPEEFWDTVARANMAKIPECKACHGNGGVWDAGTDRESEYATCRTCEACNGTGYGVPEMNKDLKIMKPAGWVKPDAGQIALIKEMAGWG